MKFIDYAIKRGNTVYVISCYSTDNLFPNYKNVFEKIVKSFKFHE